MLFFSKESSTVQTAFLSLSPKVWIKEKAPKAKDVNLQATKSWQSLLSRCERSCLRQIRMASLTSSAVSFRKTS